MDRALADRLLSRIAAALVLAPACTNRGLGDDDSGGGDEAMGDTTAQTASADGASHGEATHGEATQGEATQGEATQGEATQSGDTDHEPTTDDDGSPRFDLGGRILDVGEDPYPPLDCDAPPPKSSGAGCGAERHPDYDIVTACIDPPPGGCPAPDDPIVDDALGSCGSDCSSIDMACGPDPSQAACCYWIAAYGLVCPGRPFVVHGRERLARIIARPDWAAAIAVDVAELSPSLRAALAQAWVEDARCEHAAVASFARFALQLLAVGAPADLVARAQQAGLDELTHARAFFGLASAYGGAPVGPGPFDVSDALEGGTELAPIVLATVREGCIAETISFVQLATALAHVRDPVLRAVLATIVDEELEHVELAWSFVAWAIAHGDERLHAAVIAAFAAAERAIPRATALDREPVDVATWAAHGRLRADDHAAIARATLRDIVRPSARRLLAGCIRASVVSADPGVR